MITIEQWRSAIGSFNHVHHGFGGSKKKFRNQLSDSSF